MSFDYFFGKRSSKNTRDAWQAAQIAEFITVASSTEIDSFNAAANLDAVSQAIRDKFVDRKTAELAFSQRPLSK